MPSASVYRPVLFYSIVLSATLVLGAIGGYLSYQTGMEPFLLPLLLVGLCMPCVTAIAMIYGSRNEILIQDFWRRLQRFKITPPYLMIILLLMPCTVLLATWISLFFGYSVDQFSLSNEMSVMKGWAILGIVIPLLLAPVIEELGWRGYGVDSLRAYFNLFTASLLFGLLWAVWHLPTFFIKGYYQNQLWHLGIPYVVNFFVSVFVLSMLMNWVYYRTNRSIPAIILFHSILNLFSILFKTEPFTKCIVTAILGVFLIAVIVYDRDFFFSDKSIPIK